MSEFSQDEATLRLGVILAGHCLDAVRDGCPFTLRSVVDRVHRATGHSRTQIEMAAGSMIDSFKHTLTMNRDGTYQMLPPETATRQSNMKLLQHWATPRSK